MKVIDCKGKHYREVNALIEKLWTDGIRKLKLINVNGQRYIGRGLSGEGEIEIVGVPGDDLGVFMDGAILKVKGNAQDGVGNTMNAGKIIIEGDARDILGYGMRGGKVWIRGNVGYRVGIHMKSYLDDFPVIVVGGRTGDFLGEYMAGGLIVVLGMGENDTSPVGEFVASGMHGGKIFVRGKIEKSQVGPGIAFSEATNEDLEFIEPYIQEFASDLGIDLPDLSKETFFKIFPLTTRPYGKLYAY
ncbi:hypothetical protein QBE54_03815 [Thermatribacter velox]|jgi:glutamate synthase domain-containing protein 3|uniref:Glutamate synthase alpha subunit C-terminal domain-containing protein n=1 Tax=Thermatribacter velox TaxID=3039681 RepID=A0ABZ2YGF0_9BACT